MGRGRPPLAPGTWGEIRYEKLSTGSWKARAQYRDLAGKEWRPSCTAATKTAAARRLRSKLVDWQGEVEGEVNHLTLMSEVARLWLESLEPEVERGALAPNTLARYRSTWKVHLAARIAQLRAGEVTVKVCETAILEAYRATSIHTARGVRAVLSGVCGWALLHGGMKSNPVSALGRMRRGKADRHKTKVIVEAMRADYRDKLRAYVETKTHDTLGRPLGDRARVWAQLADLVECLLSTGGRLGEILATTKQDVARDDDGRLVIRLGWHIVRVTGKGLVREDGRKAGEGAEDELWLRVPLWSEPAWERRVAAAAGPAAPLFPAAGGGWQDSSNCTRRVRSANAAIGYDNLTSRWLRRTTGTHLDRKGVALTGIADQLGNTVEVVEGAYRARRVTNHEAAEALESLFEDDGDALDELFGGSE